MASQLGLTKADCRDLQNQMSLINGLFTQMLLGATSADMDLDRLTQLLQVYVTIFTFNICCGIKNVENLGSMWLLLFPIIFNYFRFLYNI